jgi:hypothetical protein
MCVSEHTTGSRTRAYSPGLGISLGWSRDEEPEMKKPRVEVSGEDKTTEEEEKATTA